MVEQRLADGDQGYRDHLLLEAPGGDVHAQHAGQDEVLEQQVGTDIDRRHDEDQAQEVDPGAHPAKAAAAQDRGPVIEPAGGRVGRGDLRDRAADDQREQTADQPADDDRERAAGGEGDWERGDAARQDADDRERDREIGEPAHPSGQLLRVAHVVQDLHVLVDHPAFVASCSLQFPHAFWLARTLARLASVSTRVSADDCHRLPHWSVPRWSCPKADLNATGRRRYDETLQRNQQAPLGQGCGASAPDRARRRLRNRARPRPGDRPAAADGRDHRGRAAASAAAARPA